LADEHHWTPEEITRMDPDYITEQLARIEARADHIEAAEAERKKNAKKGKGSTGRRGKRGSTEIVDADV
jgi:hypothetical protein